jgi:hypothetical protein
MSRVPDLEDKVYNVLAAAAAVGAEEGLGACDCSAMALAALLTTTGEDTP